MLQELIGLLRLNPVSAAIALQIAIVLVVALLAAGSYVITRFLLLGLVRAFVRNTVTQWDDVLVRHKVFQRLSLIIPAMVVDAFAGGMFPEHPAAYDVLRHLTLAYMILVGSLALDAFLSAINSIYDSFEVSRDRPIKSYIQVVKIIIYVLAGILILATLLNRSPWVFISGLGALTAVILLVFKDSILGFVASIQLTANDMVRRGDWIEMPKYGADGDVIDINLTTVKVQNWDKTITTIPTYSLISDAFKNWRGMSESGGRRIKRAINIDMNSVRFCDGELLDRLRQVDHLKGEIDRRQAEIDADNAEHKVDSSVLINGRRMTNLGAFRAYLVEYLRAHPKIHQEMTLLVRHLAPTADGLPIELYVFSNDQDWVAYEGIQADIFDHILASLPLFDLRVFQHPLGADFRALADA